MLVELTAQSGPEARWGLEHLRRKEAMRLGGGECVGRHAEDQTAEIL